MNKRSESDTSVRRLCSWLIRHAARSAPPKLSQRLEEEWLADFETRSSAISRLRFAFGCVWATPAICHDHSLATLPAGASTFAARAIAAEAWHHAGLFSRRTRTLGLVAILHIAVFYAFMTGLSSSLIKTNTPPLQNRVLHETRPRELPPLPPPNLNPVKLDVPKLDPDFMIPADEAQDFIPVNIPPRSMSQPVDTPPVAPPHVAKLSQGGPGVGFPSPDDFYPLLARHLEEQGIATVRVCVDASGRLTNEPTVVAGSGSARLDEGALKLARAGSGHYRATTEDGRAVDSCYPFRIRFQIRN